MIRGTTPTHTFKLPFNTDIIKSVRIIYSQCNCKILHKNTEDMNIKDDTITLKLTQEETLRFKYGMPVKIQLRILTTSDDAMNSNIIIDTVDECLDDEVIA